MDIDKVRSNVPSELFFLVGLAVMIVGSFWLAQGTEYSAIQLISSLGTIGVLVLYWGLLRVNQEQTETQKEQQKLMEFQHKSLLRIEDYLFFSADEVRAFSEIISFEQIGWRRHASKFSVRLSNYGPGPAHDLRLALVIAVEKECEEDGDTIEEFRLVATSQPLFHGNHQDPLISSEGQDGGVIGADERYVDFMTSSSFMKDEIPEVIIDNYDALEEAVSPTEVLWELEDSGFQKAKLGLQIYYRDGSGMRDPINVRFSEVKISQTKNFARGLYDGERILPADVPSPEKWKDGGIYE